MATHVYQIRKTSSACEILASYAFREPTKEVDRYYSCTSSMNSSWADSHVNCLKISDLSETYSVSILRESDLASQTKTITYIYKRQFWFEKPDHFP
jgi:hypothetical protein